MYAATASGTALNRPPLGDPFLDQDLGFLLGQFEPGLVHELLERVDPGASLLLERLLPFELVDPQPGPGDPLAFGGQVPLDDRPLGRDRLHHLFEIGHQPRADHVAERRVGEDDVALPLQVLVGGVRVGRGGAGGPGGWCRRPERGTAVPAPAARPGPAGSRSSPPGAAPAGGVAGGRRLFLGEDVAGPPGDRACRSLSKSGPRAACRGSARPSASSRGPSDRPRLPGSPGRSCGRPRRASRRGRAGRC